MIYVVMALLLLACFLVALLIHEMIRRDNERIIVTIAGGMYPGAVSCEDPRVEIRRAEAEETPEQREAWRKQDEGTERLLCAVLFPSKGRPN
jgi:hypothetical protein